MVRPSAPVGACAPAAVKIGLLTAHASRRAAGVWVGVAQLGRALADVRAGGRDLRPCRRLGAQTDGAGWDGPPLRLHDVIGARRSAMRHALAGRSMRSASRCSTRTASGCIRRSRACAGAAARAGPTWSPRTACSIPGPSARRPGRSGWSAGGSRTRISRAPPACTPLRQAEARAIRAYGLTNPICVVPNGVDLPDETGLARAGMGGRRRAGSEDPPVPGPVASEEGPGEPARAPGGTCESTAGARDWMLVIAGWDQDGARSSGSDASPRRSAFGDSLRFVGPQFDDDKAASFACADAFVLPSLSEGLPIAVLEAWSYGLPVLMTEACNLPEGFAAGAALPIGTDRAGIAAGLRRLFALSDAERRDMGARGRALVRERFTWASIGAQMAAVYRWVLGGGPPPSCVLTH